MSWLLQKIIFFNILIVIFVENISFIYAEEFNKTNPTKFSALHSKALDKKLHENYFWKALNHSYASKYFIDNKSFFLHPNGKEDLKAELFKTIELIYIKNDIETICNYPARTVWLDKNLAQDSLEFLQVCPVYDTVKKRIAPTNASLIFVEEATNSMQERLGHVFIKISGKNEFAFDFVNTPKNGFSPKYIMEILTLGGSAKFEIYDYEKNKETYTQKLDRSFFEYEMEFSKEEIEMFIYHFYELKNNAVVDYELLNVNCASVMLEIMRAFSKKTATLKNEPYLTPYDLSEKLKKKKIIKKYTITPGKTLNKIAEKHQIENYKLINNLYNISTLNNVAFYVGKNRGKKTITFNYNLIEKKITHENNINYKDYEYNIFGIDLKKEENSRTIIDKFTIFKERELRPINYYNKIKLSSKKQIELINERKIESNKMFLNSSVAYGINYNLKNTTLSFYSFLNLGFNNFNKQNILYAKPEIGLIFKSDNINFEINKNHFLYNNKYENFLENEFNTEITFKYSNKISFNIKHLKNTLYKNNEKSKNKSINFGIKTFF